LTWCLPPEFALGTLNQDTVKLATAKLFFMRYPCLLCRPSNVDSKTRHAWH
jgi:hypothetical protein